MKTGLTVEKISYNTTTDETTFFYKYIKRGIWISEFETVKGKPFNNSDIPITDYEAVEMLNKLGGI